MVNWVVSYAGKAKILIHLDKKTLLLSMWRLLSVVLFGMAFNTSLAADLGKPRVATYAGYTRIVFDVPNDSPYRIEALGAALKITLSNNHVTPSSLRLDKPEISGYTLANAGYDVIAMIATPQGVSERRGFRVQRLEPSAGNTGFRLVLDVSGAYSDISPLPPVAPLVLNKAKGQAITFVLDPGHGGTDSGALGNGLLESNLNLEVAFRVKKWLAESGIRIEMTRTDNRVFSDNKRSDLEARASLSKGKTAFVSIHANARPRSLWNSTFGMEVYYFDWQRQKPWLVSPAAEPRAAGTTEPRAAGTTEPQAATDTTTTPEPTTQAPENPEIVPVQTNIALSPSTPETPVTPNANGFGTWQELETSTPPKPEPTLPLLALPSNRTEASRGLAAGVLSQLLGATSALNRGVQVADYYVIKNAQCPAILIEMGFVTHPIEAAQFKNNNYLDRVSYGIALGLLEYVEGLVLPVDAKVPPEPTQ
jgi:N-acetylmuramoyl-L-alanine amidase